MMTPDPILIAAIQRDEGCAVLLPNGDCRSYPDPLSGAEPWTIWWGLTGADIGPDTVMTEEQATVAFQGRLEANWTALLAQLPWITSLSPPRQRVLQNMAYNLGVSGLLEFKHMLSACQSGDYSQAAQQMLSSTWAKQVTTRATRLAEQMESGVDQ
jgi:lysozyme